MWQGPWRRPETLANIDVLGSGACRGPMARLETLANIYVLALGFLMGSWRPEAEARTPCRCLFAGLWASI